MRVTGSRTAAQRWALALEAGAGVGATELPFDDKPCTPNIARNTHTRTYVDIISIGSGSGGCIRGPLLVQHVVAAERAARLGEAGERLWRCQRSRCFRHPLPAPAPRIILGRGSFPSLLLGLTSDCVEDPAQPTRRRRSGRRSTRTKVPKHRKLVGRRYAVCHLCCCKLLTRSCAHSGVSLAPMPWTRARPVTTSPSFVRESPKIALLLQQPTGTFGLTKDGTLMSLTVKFEKGRKGVTHHYQSP